MEFHGDELWAVFDTRKNDHKAWVNKFDYKKGEVTFSKELCQHFIESLCVSGDGSMAAGSGDDNVYFWDTDTWEVIEHYSAGDELSASSIDLTPDFSVMAFSRDDSVFVYNRANQEYINKFEIFSIYLQDVYLSPDASEVYLYPGANIYVYDISSGEQLKKFELKEAFRGLKFVNGMVAIMQAVYGVSFYDLETHELVEHINIPGSAIEEFDTPDGTRYFTLCNGSHYFDIEGNEYPPPLEMGRPVAAVFSLRDSDYLFKDIQYENEIYQYELFHVIDAQTGELAKADTAKDFSIRRKWDFQPVYSEDQKIAFIDEWENAFVMTNFVTMQSDTIPKTGADIDLDSYGRYYVSNDFENAFVYSIDNEKVAEVSELHMVGRTKISPAGSFITMYDPVNKINYLYNIALDELTALPYSMHIDFSPDEAYIYGWDPDEKKIYFVQTDSPENVIVQDFEEFMPHPGIKNIIDFENIFEITNDDAFLIDGSRNNEIRFVNISTGGIDYRIQNQYGYLTYLDLSFDGRYLTCNYDGANVIVQYDISNILSVENSSANVNIELFPNPTSDYITISGMDDPTQKIDIYTLAGVNIMSAEGPRV
ncbi:MAG: hypothetical protein ACLFQX_13125, partial [Candidatus Kapaibacterium sp.]